MRLTAFKSKGFKSFSELVSFKIDHALTGIVGPNGCGKSNIIDAIRWVLGESTASMLRGELLVDVIFNGTEKCNAADWCFVELQFDNSKKMGGAMWASYPTIIVRRELARDGNQKYTINGQSVRRRDVIDLFHDTGASPRSYAVIEQGMISDLAEASPDKLRSYLEIAAGVSYYKDRRRNAELRFRASEENINSINLVLEGYAKQMRSLQRQSQVVRSYQKLGNEIKTLEATSLLIQKQEANHLLMLCHQDIKGQQTQLDLVCHKVVEIKEKLKSIAEQSQSYQAELEVARQGMIDAQNVYHIAENDLHNIEEKKVIHQNRLAIFQKDEKDISHQLDNINSELKQLEEQLEALKKEVLSQEQIKAEQADDLFLLQKELQKKQLSFDESQQQKNELQRLCETETVKEQLLAEQNQKLILQIKQTELDLQNKSELINNTKDESKTYFDELNQAIDILNQSITELEEKRITVDSAKNSTDLELRELEKELAGLQTEMAALKKLVHKEYELAEALTSITTAYKVKAGKWGRALDAALGVYATAFAVDSIEHFIEKKGMPPVGYAIVESISGGLSSDEYVNNKISLPTLADVIHVDDNKKQLLSGWIAHVYVADTIEQAMEARQHLVVNERIMTKEGTVITKNAIAVQGEILGGYNWQARFQDLVERHETQHQHYIDKQKHFQEIANNFNKLNTMFQTALHEKQAKQKTLTEKTIEWHREQDRKNAIKEQYSHLQAMLNRLNDEQKILQASQTEVSENNQSYQSRYTEIEKNFEHEKQLLDSARTKIEQRQKEMSLALEKYQRLNAEQSNMTQRQSYLDSSKTDFHHRLQRLQKEIGEHEHKIKLENSDTLQEKFRQKQEDFVKKEQYFKAINSKVTAANESQNQWGKEHEVLHAQENNCREKMNDMRIKERELSIAVNQVQDLLEELALDNSTYEELMQTINTQTLAKDTIKSNIATTKEKRDKLGPINFAADNELMEIQEKNSALDMQKNDVMVALEELKSAIIRIDNETKTRLKNIFDGINLHFPILFKQFFGEGDARLETSDDSILEATFEIKVRIPGKRQLSARMLSGGEKAIVALSFIFSIIKLNPPPFCILDEVDAPLDDYRSQLFSEIIKEVAINVQCIVISHNKSTISTLPRLIGVTQAEAGISKVVAVNLAEALRVVVN